MIKKILIYSMLALLLGGAVLQNLYLENTIGQLLELTDEVEAHFVRNDQPKIAASMDRLHEAWEQAEPVLASLIDHDELDDIHIELSGLEQSLDSWHTDDVPAILARLKYNLNHIIETDRISLTNIL